MSMIVGAWCRLRAVPTVPAQAARAFSPRHDLAATMQPAVTVKGRGRAQWQQPLQAMVDRLVLSPQFVLPAVRISGQLPQALAGLAGRRRHSTLPPPVQLRAARRQCRLLHLHSSTSKLTVQRAQAEAAHHPARQGQAVSRQWQVRAGWTRPV